MSERLGTGMEEGRTGEEVHLVSQTLLALNLPRDVVTLMYMCVWCACGVRVVCVWCVCGVCVVCVWCVCGVCVVCVWCVCGVCVVCVWCVCGCVSV